MVQRVSTVAFEGIEARAVDVQVQVAPGLPAFAIVGLPDKAVSEARERVRSALIASGLALPARRITVNLAPADLPKEGSHYDLPIALGLMAAIGAIPPDALSGFTVLGELGLDGSIAPVAGVLPAAIGANSRDEGLICPAPCGAEAAWASPDIQIVAANSLIQIANHFKGTQVLSRPQPAKSRWRIRACCSSMSCRSSIPGCWIRCASRWRTARSRCRAPIIASPIRRASCWWRR
jgi:magnesium chelatase family protein